MTERDDWEGRGDKDLGFLRRVEGRPVGFNREMPKPSSFEAESPPEKEPTIFGPSVREPQETLQIRNPRPGIGGAIHPWRVTRASVDSVDVLGGIVSTQEDFNSTVVSEQEGLAVGSSGYVILTIERDSDTRAMTGTPTIAFTSGSLTASTESEQIIALAEVVVDGSSISDIIQLKFENLHIFEDLAVVNGEFKLVDLLFASRNIYDLPEPPPPPPP